MINSAAVICLLLSVALCPVSAQNQSDWNRSDLTDAALVGIIIGVIFFVIIVIALIFMCLCFLGNCWARNDYIYDQPYIYPELPPPPPPAPAPAPVQPLAVVVAKPEKESRPVFVLEKETIPPSRRSYLVRSKYDDDYYDPRDKYDDRRRGDYY